MIPTREEADRIAHAVESARAPGVEILVADAGSHDATRERALAAGARVIPCETGRARQLAAGVRAASADVLLFLHADTQLPAGWSDAVRRALLDPRVAGGAFAFRFAERSPALALVEWSVRLRLALARLPYGDQGIFVRTSVLDAIGGVPQAPLMEDLDLVRAIKRAGRLALLREPVVTSARRYLERGVWRTVGKNTVALFGWTLGVDRARLAAWYRR